jgi:LacI family transcriptional regulator
MPLIKQIKPDGMIIPDLIDDFEEVVALGLPLIAYGETVKENPQMVAMVADDEAGGAMAAKHLLERGFRNYAFCGYDEYYWSRDRCKGFSETITKAGHRIFVYPHSKTQKRNWERDQSLLIEWLKSLPKPIGVMACNDERAFDLTMSCRTGRIDVPEEVSVIGMDNNEMICELSNPPISSLHRNSVRAGFSAAEQLDRMMAGEKPDKTKILIKPDFVVTRRSTDVLAVTDPEVMKAIRFIFENANKKINVNAVIKATNLSHTRLYERFKKSTGHSIREEITHVRINRIKELLRETNLTVSEIANKLGFVDSWTLYKNFQKSTGMTAMEYRRKFSDMGGKKLGGSR